MQESPNLKKIFDVAKFQSGYFTQNQAQKAGFDYSFQSYHVKVRELEAGYSKHLSKSSLLKSLIPFDNIFL